MVALVQASTTLPIMLFSLAAGAVADNFDRRRVMLIAQCFMLVVSAALTVCAYLDLITPWLLLAFTFLIGCGTALNNPSWQASVGDMVPRADLPAAVALNSVGFNLTRSVGPAIGGAIVAAAGAAAAFAVNTLQLPGAARSSWCAGSRSCRQAPCRARRWAGDDGGAALCRDVAATSRRCCCAASSSASPRSRSWPCCRWSRATCSTAAR